MSRRAGLAAAICAGPRAAKACLIALAMGAWAATTVVAMGGCSHDAFCLNCGPGGAGSDGGRVEGGTADGALPDRFAPPDAGPVCTEAGTEVCNGLDDDCDGVIDNGFDLTSDPRNCGACGNICQFVHADSQCVDSSCVQGDCLEGFADLDPSVDGCEYRCPVYPPVDESCNGVDDDCDGMVDEEPLPAPPLDLCRTTPGTPCEGVVARCETRGAVTAYFCDYPPEVEHDPSVPNGIVLDESLCDGQDGDCDGVVDDSFMDLGQPCDDGAVGACRSTGTRVCAADHSGTTCNITSPGLSSPAPETCNGIDDDCDGMVDEDVVDDMVHVMHGGVDVWVYRYEASRPDGTATNQGSSHARACSAVDRLPWTGVSLEDAATACATAGKRLCTAAEWQAACEGTAANAYPYGDTYAADACNGADHDGVSGGGLDHVVLPTGSFAGTCASEDGAEDMSGNVKEWTDDMQGTVMGSPIYVVRGGSDESPRLGLTCTTDLSRATHDTLLPTLGFRCCADAPDAP